MTIGSDVTQIYVQGTVGRAYDITSVTFPAIEPKGTGTVVAVVTDPFGNALASTSAGTLTLTRVGGLGGTTTGDIAYSATTKRYELEITGANAAGQSAYSAVVAGLTATKAMTDAFGEPQTYFGLVTFTSVAAQVATLTAQVAALTADYNALATKYNKLVKKSKRVAKK